ncbi:MAG: hypothetical protein F4Y17_01350 [Gemmatimonadetes bacterium]|nr:hypothetical protein [Gemmatimonadota bacterium]
MQQQEPPTPVEFGGDVFAVDGDGFSDPQQGIAHHTKKRCVTQSGQGVGGDGVLYHDLDRLAGQTGYLAAAPVSTFAADTGQCPARQRPHA